MTKTTSRRAFLPSLRSRAFLVLVISFVFMQQTAYAHDPTLYYTAGKWPSGTVEGYFLGGGVPVVARVQQSIDFGAAQWNNLGRPVRFSEIGYRSDIPPFTSCDPNGTSFVFQNNLNNINLLAQTYHCGTASTIVSFNVTFNSQITWFSYVDQQPCCGQIDRWSVASHEMGHAFGHMVHWPQSSTRCQNDINKLTMCPVYFQGTAWERDLGDHDIHTFQAAYP